jgi:hypothetical protein
VGAWTAAGLCVVWLALAVVFFVVDPFDLSTFDAQTFWLIVGGLTVTFVVQEIFVARSPRWQRARAAEAAASVEHPELLGDVELEGTAPDDASALTAPVQDQAPVESPVDHPHHLRS